MSKTDNFTEENEIDDGWTCSKCDEFQGSTSIYCNHCEKLKEINKEVEDEE